MTDRRPADADEPEDDTALDRAGLDDAPAVLDQSVPPVTSRLLSTGVDIVVASILLYVLGAAIIIGVLHPKAGDKLSQAQNLTVSLGSALVAALLFSLLEKRGGSPGKRLMRLRLVTLERTLPTFTQILTRYLTIFVPLISIIGLLVVFVGLLFAIGNAQRRNLFDILARTRVVPTTSVVVPAAPPAG